MRVKKCTIILYLPRDAESKASNNPLNIKNSWGHASLITYDETGLNPQALLSFFGGVGLVSEECGCGNVDHRQAHFHNMRQELNYERYGQFSGLRVAHKIDLYHESINVERINSKINEIMQSDLSWKIQQNCSDLVLMALRAGIDYSVYSFPLYHSFNWSLIRWYLSPGVFGLSNPLMNYALSCSPSWFPDEVYTVRNLAYASTFALAWEILATYLSDVKLLEDNSNQRAPRILLSSLPGLMPIMATSFFSLLMASKEHFYLLQNVHNYVQRFDSPKRLLMYLYEKSYYCFNSWVGLRGYNALFGFTSSLMVLKSIEKLSKRNTIISAAASLTLYGLEYYVNKLMPSLFEDNSGVYRGLSIAILPLLALYLFKNYTDISSTPQHVLRLANQLKSNESSNSPSWCRQIISNIWSYMPSIKNIVKSGLCIVGFFSASYAADELLTVDCSPVEALGYQQ